MKLLFQIITFTTLFAVSACKVQSPQHTSSARAAYGNAVPDFKANKKKNQTIQKGARKEAKRKQTGNNRSYFHARPY